MAVSSNDICQLKYYELRKWLHKSEMDDITFKRGPLIVLR